jgi:hypothetical protein
LVEKCSEEEDIKMLKNAEKRAMNEETKTEDVRSKRIMEEVRKLEDNKKKILEGRNEEEEKCGKDGTRRASNKGDQRW